MAEIAHSIDLKLPERLRDPNFRKKFFLAEASARIAAQLIALRKRRGLNQTELANRVGTGQPAISRVERADYNNWSFNTLRNIAEELDARIRVIIEPAEDILWEYASQDDALPKTTSKPDCETAKTLRESGPGFTTGSGPHVHISLQST